MLDNIWLVLLAVSSGMGIIFLSLQEKSTQYSKSVDITAATHLINRENGLFVDVRESDVFAQGHIANSRNLPLSTLTETDQSIANKLGKNAQEKPLILVCNRGNEAKKAFRILQQQGFKNVKILQEGIAGWIKSGLPISTKK